MRDILPAKYPQYPPPQVGEASQIPPQIAPTASEKYKLLSKLPPLNGGKLFF